MAQVSPQAVNIPDFRSPVEYIAHPPTSKSQVDQQGLIDGTNAAIGAGPYLIPADKTRLITVRTLQNASTNPVKYKYVSPISSDVVSTNNFNGILAGGNVVDDGLGSQLNASDLDGDISIMCDTGVLRVALTQAYAQDLRGRTGQAPSVISPYTG